MDYKKRSKTQKSIDRLMLLAGQELPVFPIVPSSDVRILRAKLILEEALETIEALGVNVWYPPNDREEVLHSEMVNGEPNNCLRFVDNDRPNLALIADGCADISVVTIGTLSACGINDCSILQAVDENNLQKFGPGGYRREDGKWIKPPNHQPPDIHGILVQQGMK